MTISPTRPSLTLPDIPPSQYLRPPGAAALHPQCSASAPQPFQNPNQLQIPSIHVQAATPSPVQLFPPNPPWVSRGLSCLVVQQPPITPLLIFPYCIPPLRLSAFFCSVIGITFLSFCFFFSFWISPFFNFSFFGCGVSVLSLSPSRGFGRLTLRHFFWHPRVLGFDFVREGTTLRSSGLLLLPLP